ncbi:MAG: PAS domain S-box protein, partial [Candidatus Lernaella stagnicola]|nr:PAS domain S-box protein [Candidatus Lernaella stagnicola]
MSASSGAGLVFSSVGKDVLRDIVFDFVHLLGTSVAVYEKDGESAIEIFHSAWCGILDDASQIVRPGDSQQTLNSGQRRCHGACWYDASCEAVETGEIVDVECRGGIRLYAVPIFAGDEVVGSINFGYGDPPTDRERLQGIAERYQIDVEEPLRSAQEYESRPPFIIENAKARLRTAARLIGEIIERKQTEDRLQTTEARMRQLFNSIESCVVVYEPIDNGEDFLIVDINPAGERCSKVKKEEVVGKRVTDVFPGITDIGLLDVLRHVYKTGETTHLPVRRYEDDRITEWVENTAYRLPNGQIVVVYEDTSRQHFAETALRESEKKHKAYVENAPGGILVTDAEGMFVDVNTAASHITGYTKEELLGMMINEISPPELFPDADDMFRQLKADGSLSTEVLMQTKDGRIVNAALDAVALSEGQYIAFCTDITERKLAEKRSRMHERLLQFAIDQMPVPVVVADSPGVVIRMLNTKALELTANRPSDGESIALEDRLSFWPSYHPDGTPYKVDELPLTAAIKRGEKTTNREMIIRHDGHDHWVSASAAPLLDEEGDIIAGIVVFPDITEFKLAEQARLSLEEQLQQAQKMEAVGRLAGGVAHDFNNIMTAVQGLAELLLEEFDPEDPKARDLRDISKAADSGARLTEQLLAFSRKQIIHPRALDLNETIAEAGRMLRRLIGEDIELELATDEA